MVKMKLFHGTSFKRGQQILANGKIKGNEVDRVYSPDNISLPTTDGYVYLTDFAKAAYYANKTSMIYDDDTHIILFELEIDDSILEPDLDEIEYTLKPIGKTKGFKDINNPTVEECWNECRALRIKDDLILESGNFKYAILRSNKYSSDDQDDSPYNSRDFTMKIVGLRDVFDKAGENEKSELYNQINWKNEI